MDQITKKIAVFLLGVMFVLMFFSSWNDAATFDEIAHIPAGYSYLTQRDFRLNPEHPPLIKDLTALPLLFLNLNFPTDIPEWSERIEDRQWDMGKIFLYGAGNNPEQILRFSRFPVMLLAILFGWLLFDWARKNYGNKVGLLTLFFYALSPTVIAHSRYVTTDLGASLGFFVALVSFFCFLKKQDTKNIVVSGILLGVAFLLKFSTVILTPIYVVLGLLWVFLDNFDNKRAVLRESFKTLCKIALIGIVALVVVSVVYAYHVWDFPVSQQVSDITAILNSSGGKMAVPALTWMSNQPVLQPLAEYLFGVVSVVQRAAGGNSAHFMGTVSSQATAWYFPVLYLLKESLVFHIFTLFALWFSVKNIIKSKEKNAKALAEWMKDNFVIVGSMFFVAVYFLQSVTGNLNIGVRHVMPTLPFIYFLVARQVVRWVSMVSVEQPASFWGWLKYALAGVKSLGRYSAVSVLLLVMFVSTVITFPYYLSYFNILAGGTANGYKIATDSNYDWGQDMKRLKFWMDDNGVAKIALHYFGGGNSKYYFGDNYEDWWSSKGQPAEGTWFAISANAREGSMAKPVRGFEVKPGDDYAWLRGKEPIARAGSSIFIYKF